MRDGGHMLREISRQEAEGLLVRAKIKETRVEQQNKEVQVMLMLADDNTCLVRFDRQSGKKQYFLQHA